MCETCAVPRPDEPISRGAKVRLALFCGVAVIATVAVVARALTGEPAPAAAGKPRSVPAEQVFRADMRQQTANARALVVQANGSSALAALARAIEREDSDISPPAAGAATRDDVAPSPTLRRALRRHIDEDRIIARVELATGTDPSARRDATRLLAASQSWRAALAAA